MGCGRHRLDVGFLTRRSTGEKSRLRSMTSSQNVKSPGLNRYVRGMISLASNDAIASNTATHNPRANRSGARSYRVRLRDHDSALGAYKIGMAVYRCTAGICAAHLATDSQRSALRLRVLARILVHSWHRRARAP